MRGREYIIEGFRNQKINNMTTTKNYKSFNIKDRDQKKKIKHHHFNRQ